MCSDLYNAPLGLSAPTASSSTIAGTLLAALWRSPDRIYQIGRLDRLTGKFKNLHVQDVNSAVSCAHTITAKGQDAYFACAEYITPNSRAATNVSSAWAFWMDIDCGDDKATSGNGYATEADARNALEQFCKNARLVTAGCKLIQCAD